MESGTKNDAPSALAKNPVRFESTRENTHHAINEIAGNILYGCFFHGVGRFLLPVKPEVNDLFVLEIGFHNIKKYLIIV